MNIRITSLTGILGCLLGFSIDTLAQSPTDELMMPKKEICFLLNYEYGDFDHYWEGDSLRENATIATVQRRTLLLMAAYGITDRLDAYVGLPYVSTNSTTPNGGKFAGTSGIQDLSLGLKYKVIESKQEKSDFSLFASVSARGFLTFISYLTIVTLLSHSSLVLVSSFSPSTFTSKFQSHSLSQYKYKSKRNSYSNSNMRFSNYRQR